MMLNVMHKYISNQQAVFWLLAIPFMVLAILMVGIDQKVAAISKTNNRAHDTQVDLLHGTVSHNELIDNLERLGIKCLIHEGVTDSLSVDKVRLGSSAYYGGVLTKDSIKHLYRLSANTYNLCLVRAGERYQITLRTLPARSDKGVLGANIEKTTLATAIKKISIPGSASKQDTELVKKLLPYDIELIIDISGSMNQIDGTGDLTKWQWCGAQVLHFAERLAPYHKTFTITTFNTDYETTERCTPDKVEQVFASIEPQGGTDLLDPLMSRLNNAFRKYKPGGAPVLIVVITDGLPNVPADPQAINRALIDFSMCLTNPDQVVITFLQIGDNFDGRDFCMDIDDNLVKEGAKYDIVDTKTFFELKEKGLVNAMINAISEAQENRNLSRQDKNFKHFMKSLPPSNPSVSPLGSELKKRQAERQAIEQQMPGQ